MNFQKLLGLKIFILSTAVFALTAKSTSAQEEDSTQLTKASEQKILKSLEGKWKGKCSTWFQPGKLADESNVTGEFERISGTNFLRHTYKGTMKGKPRTGEETIVFNPIKKKYQISWFDDFHMNYGILFSEGKSLKQGFSVTGTYSAGEGRPDWKWKTVYELEDENNLVITAYNIMPNGKEAKAVETVYSRILSK